MPISVAVFPHSQEVILPLMAKSMKLIYCLRYGDYCVLKKGSLQNAVFSVCGLCGIDSSDVTNVAFPTFANIHLPLFANASIAFSMRGLQQGLSTSGA